MIVPEISAAAVFAEDIRDEMAGTHTIVGVLPDALQVPAIGGFIPKFAAYVRTSIRLDIVRPQSDLLVRLYGVENDVIVTSESASETIEAAREVAKESGSQAVTMVTKILASPFPITAEGQIRATSQYGDGVEVLAGFLHIKVLPGEGESQSAG